MKFACGLTPTEDSPVSLHTEGVDASLILRYYTKVSSGQMIDKYEYFKNPT